MSAADLSRRRFLSAGGAALLAGWASGQPALRAALAQARRAAASPSPLPFEFFTAREGAELAAITAHIWPVDDFPGALETGIPHFIDGRGRGSLLRRCELRDLRCADRGGPVRRRICAARARRTRLTRPPQRRVVSRSWPLGRPRRRAAAPGAGDAGDHALL